MPPRRGVDDGPDDAPATGALKGKARRRALKEKKASAGPPAAKRRKSVAADGDAPVAVDADAPQEPGKVPEAAGAVAEAEALTAAGDDLEDEELSPSSVEAYDEFEDQGSSDDSEDDAPRNRIGNVPLEWYDDEDHVGYDLAGQRIARTLSTSEIDALLESKDNPDAWRTIKDHKNQREIVLTDTDLEVIRRLRQRILPSGQNAEEDMFPEPIENKDAAIHPLNNAHPPKSRFLPSKWERMKVKRLKALIREGKIRPPPPPKPEVWDLWADEAPKKRKKAPPPLPAPKMALPGHASSYNPPSEYLMTEEEKKAWEEQDEQDRELSHLPEKFACLRHVPAFPEIMQERFKRCLDLYLVPRALRQRMNVDPESLLPKLPSPKDLRPFPTHVAVSYEGHTGIVRGLALDEAGQWLATVSGDGTLRVWEVATGRPYWSVDFGSAVTAVSWCPKHPLLAVASDATLYFVDPKVEPQPVPIATPATDAGAEEGKADADGEAAPAPATTVEELLTFRPPAGTKASEGEKGADEKGDEEAAEKALGAKARATLWKAVPADSPLYKSGCRLSIATDGDVQQLTWHHKGNYCAAVSPRGQAPSNQCIIHALQGQKSMRPFQKFKGNQGVMSCAFHTTKPWFFVATKQSVRVFDLQQQVPVKQLVGGARWISSLSLHPTGDHIILGSYDRRILWYDLDLSSKPYKTFQYHDRAVRRVAFHRGKFPLMAAGSDDGTVSVLHAKVYSDLMQSPMIVPVKRLRGHKVHEGLGVLDCVWHPQQPWLFTAGADGHVYMWA